MMSIWLAVIIGLVAFFETIDARRRLGAAEIAILKLEARIVEIDGQYDEQYSNTRATMDAAIRKSFELDNLRGMQVQELIANQRSLVAIVNALVTGEQITLEQLNEMSSTSRSNT